MNLECSILIGNDSVGQNRHIPVFRHPSRGTQRSFDVYRYHGTRNRCARKGFRLSPYQHFTIVDILRFQRQHFYIECRPFVFFHPKQGVVSHIFVIYRYLNIVFSEYTICWNRNLDVCRAKLISYQHGINDLVICGVVNRQFHLSFIGFELPVLRVGHHQYGEVHGLPWPIDGSIGVTRGYQLCLCLTSSRSTRIIVVSGIDRCRSPVVFSIDFVAVVLVVITPFHFSSPLRFSCRIGTERFTKYVVLYDIYFGIGQWMSCNGIHYRHSEFTIW